MGKSSRDDRKAAQERLAAERAAQKAADRRRSIIMGVVVVLVIGLIAALVGITLLQQSKESKDVGALPPSAAAPSYGIVVNNAATSGATASPKTNQPTLELYEDFQCPACKKFEDENASVVEEFSKDGSIKVVYHPLQFLDGNLNNDSSARAANAAGCADVQGKYVAYHDEVYANQPEQEGAGYTNEDLITFGKNVGITTNDFAECVNNQTYAKWAKAVQRYGDDVPITQTPTIILNGEKLDPAAYSTSDAFRTTLSNAVAGK